MTHRPDHDKALALVRAGKSFTAAAAETGLTRSAVAGLCHRHGVKGQNGGDPDNPRRVVALYRDGMPIDKIAARCGLSSGGGVYVYLQQAGVKSNRQQR